jgi:hypothetical protein
MRAAKHEDLAVWERLSHVYYASLNSGLPTPLEGIRSILDFSLQIISYALLFMFARATVEHYQSDRFRTYSGIGLGLFVLSIVPTFLLMAIYFFVVFVALA